MPGAMCTHNIQYPLAWKTYFENFSFPLNRDPRLDSARNVVIWGNMFIIVTNIWRENGTTQHKMWARVFASFNNTLATSAQSTNSEEGKHPSLFNTKTYGDFKTTQFKRRIEEFLNIDILWILFE